MRSCTAHHFEISTSTFTKNTNVIQVQSWSSGFSKTSFSFSETSVRTQESCESDKAVSKLGTESATRGSIFSEGIVIDRCELRVASKMGNKVGIGIRLQCFHVADQGKLKSRPWKVGQFVGGHRKGLFESVKSRIGISLIPVHGVNMPFICETILGIL